MKDQQPEIEVIYSESKGEAPDQSPNTTDDEFEVELTESSSEQLDLSDDDDE